MLEIQRIRNEKESVLQGLKKRNIDASQTIDKVLLIDQEWRSNKTELDKLSSE
ncbi:MAG: Seryl-tRNA synthetase N-terminal domain, partial [Bacteroidota bacterium]